MNTAPISKPVKRMTVLLAEPDQVMRRTVCDVASEINLASIVPAESLAMADERLARATVGCLLISFDEDFEAGLEIVKKIRAGNTACRKDVPVAVMLANCDNRQIDVLRELGLRRIVLKPFKVKTILATIVDLIKTPQPVAA